MGQGLEDALSMAAEPDVQGTLRLSRCRASHGPGALTVAASSLQDVLGVSLQRTNSAQRVSLERGRLLGQRHSADLGSRLPRPGAPGSSRLSLEQSACASPPCPAGSTARKTHLSVH